MALIDSANPLYRNWAKSKMNQKFLEIAGFSWELSINIGNFENGQPVIAESHHFLYTNGISE